MRRGGLVRLGIVLVVAAVGASTAAAGEGGPIARLEALGRALRGSPAWRAPYRQTYLPAGMTEGEEVEGTAWVGWPDHALFSSGTPVNQRMAMDGRTVRLVDLEARTCDDHLLSEEEWSRIPLAAVLDPQRALDRFSILALGSDGVTLVPRQPGGVARVEVVVGPAGLPTEVVVVDPQGATNRLRFTDWTAVDGPPAGVWLPQPPPGVECVAEPR